MKSSGLVSTRKLGLERLEDKLPLAADVSFLDVGDSLALRIDTADQALSFQATESGYQFSLESGQFVGTDNANVSGNGTSLLTVSSSGITAFDLIEVDDFAAGGRFHFLDSGLNSVTETFEVRLDRMDAGEITFSGMTQLIGSASLNAETSKNILVNAGANVSTVNGDLLLSANQQETSRTDLGKGISIIDSTIEVLGDADLEIHGTGGLKLSEGFVGSPIGVNIEDSIISGGVAGNATLITGKGGNRESDHNFGIYVRGTGEVDPTAVITSQGGDVRLEGEGGGVGQSFNNKGILVDKGLVIATGLGEVTVIGQGGFSDNGNNVGVGVRADFGVGGIKSSGGDVFVEGTGGNDNGVEVYLGGEISAEGNGSVTVLGTGGNFSGENFDGVLIWGVSNSGQSSIITSAGGLITVNGVGGGDSTAGSGNHRGVHLQNGGQIVGPGDVVVNGTGGVGELASSHGVFVNGESAGGVASAIVSTGGTLEINGWGGGSNDSGNNLGICVWQGGLIQGAANSPTIIEGTGGNASGDNNDGIRITGVSSTDQSSTITSAGGPITINGFAGGTGASTYNSGTEVLNGAIIEGPENEELVVSGTGGIATGGHDQGVWVAGISAGGAHATITSRGGDVTIHGKGGGTGDVGYNRGVAVWNGGRVTAGEMGDVTVTGVGGTDNGPFNLGVSVAASDADTRITSSGGDVLIRGTGQGGSSSSNNRGVEVLWGGVITAGGEGEVTVEGIGGQGTGGYDHGILVFGNRAEGQRSTITSNGGIVSISGEGGGTGSADFNTGVYVQNGGLIESPAAALLQIEGHGGKTAGVRNYGVWVAGAENDQVAEISSRGGIVDINGVGGGSASEESEHNWGVVVQFGGKLEGPEESPLSVSATGGEAGGVMNAGIYVGNSFSEGDFDATITSRGGDVFVMGQGGNGTKSHSNGVWINNHGIVSAGAMGDVTVTGTGGISSGGSNRGVLVSAELGEAKITSNGGRVVVQGTGGGSDAGTSGGNYGVQVTDGGKILGQGDVVIHGTGGLGGGNVNHGVNVRFVSESGAVSSIVSQSGSLDITGVGGGVGTSDYHYGVLVLEGGLIQGSSDFPTTIHGTGGNSEGDVNAGVMVLGMSANNIPALITSTGGPMSITGVGGGFGNAKSSNGVQVERGGVIRGPSASELVVHGTGGVGARGSHQGIAIGNVEGDFRPTITSEGGDVRLIGQGGGTDHTNPGLNEGVMVSVGGLVTAGGNGEVSVSGIGGIGDADNHGVGVHWLPGSGIRPMITSGGGAVVVNGTGGQGEANWNNGVHVSDGGIIQGPGDFPLTINGFGGDSRGEPSGIVVTSNLEIPAEINSRGGDVFVSGTGGGDEATEFSIGVRVNNNGKITGPMNGVLKVSGQGGQQEGAWNPGVALWDRENGMPTIASEGGDVEIEGFQGFVGAGPGIYVGGGFIDVQGDGNLLMTGHAENAVGIALNYDNATELSGEIKSASGSIRLVGINNGLESGNNAIYAANSFKVDSGKDLVLVGPKLGLYNPNTQVIATGEILVDAAIEAKGLINDFSATSIAWGGGVWVAEINGPTPESQYDQLDIEGTVELGGLDLTGSYQPQVGENFILIDNDGVDAIVGKWFYDGGLVNEGDYIAFNGTLMQVSYLGGDGNDLEMTAVNLLPTLDSIDDLVLSEDAGPQVIDLTGISSGGDETQVLAISAISSNPDLIPNPQIDYTDPDSTGTLHFTPVRDTHGTSTITILLEDGGPDNDLATKEGNGILEVPFEVVVQSVNDAPTLTVVDELDFNQPVTDFSVSLSEISPGPNESEQPVAITASTDNPGFLTEISVDYTSGSSGTLLFSTVPGALGRGIIYVTIEDGGLDNDLNTREDNASTTRAIDVGVTTKKRSYASYDHTRFGKIEGTYRDTYWRNAGVQRLQETLFRGNKRSRLEHHWDFDLVGADSSLEFVVDASHDSTSEQFRFQYRVEGTSSWKNLITTTGNESWQYSTIVKNPSLADDTRVTVRVIDSNRSVDDDAELGILSVERMFFRSSRLSEIKEGVNILAFDPEVNEDGDKGKFWIQLSDRKRLDEDLEVFYAVGGTADSSDYAEGFAGFAVIPAGSLKVSLPITPIDDGMTEGSESIELRLLESEDYRLVGDPVASIRIKDNELIDHEAYWEHTAHGSHDLNYTQGWYTDGNRESITEQVYAGGNRTRFTHYWKFDLTGESQVVFRGRFEVTSEPDLDDFQVTYSTDGSSWKSLGRLTSADGIKDFSKSIDLPAGVSDVWVRMIDRYRRNGDTTPSTVAVDLIQFERVSSSAFAPAMFFQPLSFSPSLMDFAPVGRTLDSNDKLFELLGAEVPEILDFDSESHSELVSYYSESRQEDETDKGVELWLQKQEEDFASL